MNKELFDLCGLWGRRSKDSKAWDIDPPDSSLLSCFGIKKRRSNRKIWCINPMDDAIRLPEDIESILADYTIAMPPPDPTNDETDITCLAIPFRPPIDMILQLLLAEAKRKLQLTSVSQSDASAKLRGLFWGCDQVISLAGTRGARGNVRDCAVDYALWYGDPSLLETNCVIIPPEQHNGVGDCGIHLSWTINHATALIQSNKMHQKGNADVYGIRTNGIIWAFFHLDRHKRYSSRVLDWRAGQGKSIVGLISRIINDAATIRLRLGELPGEWRQTRSTWNRPEWGSSVNEDFAEGAMGSERLHPVPSPHLPNMDWLARLEAKVTQIFHRHRSLREEQDLGEVFKNARAERQKKKQQLPSKAVGDIAPEDLYHIFGLRKEVGVTDTWRLKSSERKTTPDHLWRMLGDYDNVFDGAEQNEQVMRGRLNCVVVSTLAAKRMDNSDHYKSLRWALEKPLSFKWPIQGKRTDIRGRMDFALWYGSRADLETNMVVMEAKKLHHASTCVPQAIAYMAIIHQARKKAKRANAPIFGIATDSYLWHFIRLDPSGVVSDHFVDWTKKPHEIISLLHKIMDQAAVLSPVSTQTLSRQPTVQEAGDITWPADEMIS